MRLEADPPYHKLVCGWNGGYLHGSSWRVNRGIETVQRLGAEYHINAATSRYVVHRMDYRISVTLWLPLNLMPQNGRTIFSEAEAFEFLEGLVG